MGQAADGGPVSCGISLDVLNFADTKNWRKKMGSGST